MSHIPHRRNFRRIFRQIALNEKNIKPLAKNVLILFRLTAAVSATDASIHNRMFGSGDAMIMKI